MQLASLSNTSLSSLVVGVDAEGDKGKKDEAAVEGDTRQVRVYDNEYITTSVGGCRVVCFVCFDISVSIIVVFGDGVHRTSSVKRLVCPQILPPLLPVLCVVKHSARHLKCCSAVRGLLRFQTDAGGDSQLRRPADLAMPLSVVLNFYLNTSWTNHVAPQRNAVLVQNHGNSRIVQLSLWSCSPTKMPLGVTVPSSCIWWCVVCRTKTSTCSGLLIAGGERKELCEVVLKSLFKESRTAVSPDG